MDIRPAIPGNWYPRSPDLLAQALDDYLSQASAETIHGRLWGVIVPHAGHRYSGAIAAQAFAHLQGLHPDLAAVISPYHSLGPAPLVTSAHESYATPLGDVPIDGEAVTSLDEEVHSRTGFHLSAEREDPEHGVEVELPFLQRVIPGFRLLPLMIFQQDAGTARALGDALAQVLEDQSAILIASSDLSHFYPQETALKLDREVLRRVEAFDPEAVLAAEVEGAGFACGRGAIAAVLWAAQALGADSVRIVGYGTSSDVTGDFDSVVGYGAAVIFTSPDGEV